MSASASRVCTTSGLRVRTAARICAANTLQKKEVMTQNNNNNFLNNNDDSIEVNKSPLKRGTVWENVSHVLTVCVLCCYVLENDAARIFILLVVVSYIQ